MAVSTGAGVFSASYDEERGMIQRLSLWEDDAVDGTPLTCFTRKQIALSGGKCDSSCHILRQMIRCVCVLSLFHSICVENKRCLLLPPFRKQPPHPTVF